MTDSSDSCSWNKKWISGGPTPARTWTRENYGNRCSYLQSLYTQNDLNMRRKAEVLQYNTKQYNNNRWTKSERFAYLSKNRVGRIKNNSSTNKSDICDNSHVSRSSRFLLFTGNSNFYRPKFPTSFSNVPKDSKNNQDLYYDKSVPLTLWKTQLQYGTSGGKNLAECKITDDCNTA